MEITDGILCKLNNILYLYKKQIKVSVGKLRQMIKEESRLVEEIDGKDLHLFFDLLNKSYKEVHWLVQLYDSGELNSQEGVQTKNNSQKSLLKLKDTIPNFIKKL